MIYDILVIILALAYWANIYNWKLTRKWVVKICIEHLTIRGSGIDVILGTCSLGFLHEVAFASTGVMRARETWSSAIIVKLIKHRFGGLFSNRLILSRYFYHYKNMISLSAADRDMDCWNMHTEPNFRKLLVICSAHSSVFYICFSMLFLQLISYHPWWRLSVSIENMKLFHEKRPYFLVN